MTLRILGESAGRSPFIERSVMCLQISRLGRLFAYDSLVNTARIGDHVGAVTRSTITSGAGSAGGWSGPMKVRSAEQVVVGNELELSRRISTENGSSRVTTGVVVASRGADEDATVDPWAAAAPTKCQRSLNTEHFAVGWVPVNVATLAVMLTLVGLGTTRSGRGLGGPFGAAG